MAVQESDREDLIREAVAFVDRVEWIAPHEAEPVFVGLRKDGSLSVYFGQDPVYQFNPDMQLRRAYVDGLLYRTQGETLASLERKRTAAETIMQRIDLTSLQLHDFLSTMQDRIELLANAIRTNSTEQTRAVLQNRSVADLQDAVQILSNKSPQLAPAIATRRK